MNFLGMGPMELMVILVMALVVFGPGKLPEIAGQVGRVVRDFRRMTGDLSSEFNRTLSLEIEERKAAQAPAPPAPPADQQNGSENGYAEAAPAVSEAAAPAYEPAEAPQAVATSSVPEPVVTETTPAPAPVVASKRKTIDPDLAPPY